MSLPEFEFTVRLTVEAQDGDEAYCILADRLNKADAAKDLPDCWPGVSVEWRDLAEGGSE